MSGATGIYVIYTLAFLAYPLLRFDLTQGRIREKCSKLNKNID